MRHKLYSVLYLVIIIFYILRPSLPYIEYSINRKYIEKNLCVQRDNPENLCHGKCYLHKQVNKQSPSPDADRTGDSKIIPDKKMDDHLIVEELISKPAGKEILLEKFYFTRKSDPFRSIVFVPPKF